MKIILTITDDNGEIVADASTDATIDKITEYEHGTVSPSLAARAMLANLGGSSQPLQFIVESAKTAFLKHYPLPYVDPGYVNFNDLPEKYRAAWTAAIEQALSISAK